MAEVLEVLVERARAVRDDPEELLPILLEAWGVARVRPLASAIDALSALLWRRHPPLETEEAWHRLAQTRDPAAVPALLCAPLPMQSAPIRKRSDALRSFAADPRIARFAEQLAAVLRHTPMPGRSLALAHIRSLLYVHGPIGAATIDARIDTLCALADTSPRPLERTLLDDIFANPDEEGPRYVYADWLASQGDPLGAHLSRALSGATLQELDALYPAHHQRFLCALFGVVPPSSLVQRRGLVDRVCLHGGPLAVDRPGWSLVREVELLDPSEETLGAISSLASLPQLSVLGLRFAEARRRVGAVTVHPLLSAWPSLAEMGLPELCLWSPPPSDIASLETWPALRCLWLVAPLQSPAFAALPQISGSMHLGLWSSLRGLRELLAIACAARLPGAVARIRVQRPHLMGRGLEGVAVAVARDGRGAFGRLLLTGLAREHLPHIGRIVEPETALREIAIETASGGDSVEEDALRADVVRALSATLGRPLSLVSAGAA